MTTSSHGTEILEASDVLRRRVLLAVGIAIAKLADETAGVRNIEREGEMRACIALARLAPAMLRFARDHTPEEIPFKLPPDLSEEEAIRLLDELQRANGTCDAIGDQR